MKMKEAVEIVKEALGEKATDKRTKVAKAIEYIEERVKWDDAKLEGIIDETIEEFEGKENDYAGNG